MSTSVTRIRAGAAALAVAGLLFVGVPGAAALARRKHRRPAPPPR